MAVSELSYRTAIRRLQHWLVAGCSLLALVVSPLHAQPAKLDQVVAIVNEDVVLKSEFDGRWAQVQQQLASAQGPLPPEAELRKQVLDQLILENLQLQLAQRAGVRVDDNQLNNAMGVVAQQNKMSFEQFSELLQQQGLYEATRDAIRKELIIGQFQSGAVNRRINITRQEVENYLRSEAGNAAIAPEYHVAHILIPGADNDTRAGELAKLLYQQIRDGADIRQLAASRQISGIAVNGGDLGWMKLESLPTVFATVVPTLASGEVSEPFTSPNGYHLVKVMETRGGSELKQDQFHVRHILIKPTEIRTEQQAETLVNALYQRIQNGEDFGDIARQNTDDPNSMVSGGDLNWVSDGMLPPDFMGHVHSTPVGSRSAPFRVATGWHIIEVMEERIEDVTEQNKRYQAEQILRERKFENELQNWLTEIRDTNYIDIKDEVLSGEVPAKAG
jgi:peptidyl-prolyl cis-trans isomerase SurA